MNDTARLAQALRKVGGERIVGAVSKGMQHQHQAAPRAAGCPTAPSAFTIEVVETLPTEKPMTDRLRDLEALVGLLSDTVLKQQTEMTRMAAEVRDAAARSDIAFLALGLVATRFGGEDRMWLRDQVCELPVHGLVDEDEDGGEEKLLSLRRARSMLCITLTKAAD